MMGIAVSEAYEATAEWRRGAFIDGWVDGGGETIEVHEPATGDGLGAFAAADAETVNRAVRAAAAAQPGWEALGPIRRGMALNRLAEVVEANDTEIASQIVRESGSAWGKARGEVTGTVAELRTAAALCVQPQGRVLPSLRPGQLSIARRVPHGVVAVITPWNVPFVLAMRSIAPAIACGNTVVLKPDPNTPVCGGVSVVELMQLAELPPAVLTLVLGSVDTGEALVSASEVGMVSFTGSSAAGRRIAEVGGRNLKKLALELGGNSPFVVLDDADLDRASSTGAWASFQHQGQICMAASRHLVHESVAEEYVGKLVEKAAKLKIGNPRDDEAVTLGPLINDKQHRRVTAIVEDTVSEGAQKVVGGASGGLFFSPTVLAGVTPSMRAFREEIFGPVAPVTTFSTDDEAAALAAQTEYGLAAAVHSSSRERARSLAESIPAGMVHVNDQTVNDAPFVPFGGRGASGNGSRFGGEANWEAFTQWQWITVADDAPNLPI